MFVNPKQVTQLRKDDDFISADKYGVGTNVMMTGEIGRIANCRVVPSKKVVPVNAVTAVAGVYTITIGTKAVTGDKFTVNGVDFVAGTDFALTTDTATGNATALTAALNASTDPKLSVYTWTSSGAAITATEDSGKEGAGVPVVVITKTTEGTMAAVVATTTKGVSAVAAHYICPIVTQDSETETDTAALTIFFEERYKLEPERDVPNTE